MIVPFYVDYAKYDEEADITSPKLVPAGTSYIVAAGETYNEAALVALEICAAVTGQIPTDIREDL